MAIDVGKAIAYLDLDTSKFSSGIANAKSALSEFVSSTDSLSTKFQNLGTSISGVGATMTKTLTLPLTGIATAATKVAMDFDGSMSKVQAVSGATADEMERLREKAIEMGAKTKFSAKESADAFTYMAMAGWDAEQMMDGIAGIMSLAAADGLDLATTSDIVTDALTAFGLKASDSAHFADVLAQASSSANTNVSMLGESFKFVAPVAGSLGMSVEDVSIALALMANSGIKGSQAGTALRSSLTNLVKPTEQMQSMMTQLGLEVTNSDGSMKSLREIIDALRGSFSKLSESEKANAAATLFGKEAMSGMLAIINSSEEDYNKLADAIDNASGRADEMSDTMMDNLSGALTLLKSALESLMIKIGEALVPTIRELAEFITKLVEKLNKLSDEQIQQIVKIGAIVVAIGPLLMIVGKVITIIGSVISIGSKLIAGAKIVVGFVSGVLIPAISAINAPVLAIIAVVTALIAAGVALYKNWDTVCEVAKNAWSAIVDVVSSAVEAIGQFFTNLVDGIKNFISSMSDAMSSLWESVSAFFEQFVDFFRGAAESIKSAVMGMIDTIVNWGVTFLDKAREIGRGFTSAITEGVTKVGEFFAGIFTDIIDSIRTIGPRIFQTGKDIITSLWDGMKSIFTSLVSWIKNSITNLFKPISDALDKVLNPVKSLFSGVTSKISGLFSGSHAIGLDRVPYDGYVAQLHEGERVLTKEESKDYNSKRSSSGDTFIFQSPKKIDEYEAARLLKQTKRELDLAF